MRTAALDVALSDASFVRLRRARDRVACAQTLLESVSEIAGKRADAAGTSPTGSEAERDLGAIAATMREAVELLAREWPDDYAAWAVEWLLVELTTPRRLVCTVCRPTSMLK
jgi:hypothetical protein